MASKCRRRDYGLKSRECPAQEKLCFACTHIISCASKDEVRGSIIPEKNSSARVCALSLQVVRETSSSLLLLWCRPPNPGVQTSGQVLLALGHPAAVQSKVVCAPFLHQAPCWLPLVNRCFYAMCGSCVLTIAIVKEWQHPNYSSIPAVASGLTCSFSSSCFSRLSQDSVPYRFLLSA